MTTDDVRAIVREDNPENLGEVLDFLDDPEVYDYYDSYQRMTRYWLLPDGWRAIPVGDAA